MALQQGPQLLGLALGDRDFCSRNIHFGLRITQGLHGFVRLFVDLPPQRLRQVALLDPPVSQLHLEPQRFGGGG